MYTRLHHPTRGGCLKTTGQIQNRGDFFGPGIAEVPPKNCLDSGLEFGSRVGGGNWRAWEMRPRFEEPGAKWGDLKIACDFEAGVGMIAIVGRGAVGALPRQADSSSS
jgi:hypothetical protein